MKYDFREFGLAQDFSSENVQKAKQFIDSSTCFSIVGMPGVGVSQFTRYLLSTHLAYFVFVDAYELSTLTKTSLYALLLKELGGKDYSSSDQILLALCQKQLRELTKQHKKIVILFNQFDLLKKELGNSFIANLRSLRNVDAEKIVLVTAGNKLLFDLAPHTLSGNNLSLFAKTLFLRPYLKEDLLRLFTISPTGLKPKKKELEKILFSCGGHFQLLQLLLKSEKLDELSKDPIIRMQLKEIYEHVNYTQRKMLQKIAFKKMVRTVDDYLLDIGLIKKSKNIYKLFTPLLAEYITSHVPLRLPVQEARLFTLLKQHLGKAVSKEQIFATVWEEKQYEASDWTLNALIYRLRKNPSFVQRGYVIENQKKIGYTLVKN